MILLYGRPASGKTALRRRLAKATGRPHASIDGKRARTSTAKAAQAQLILQARRQPDLIAECCHPHPALAELATVKVLVHAPDWSIRQRLTQRDWSPAHINRALAETYPVRPDYTCDTTNHADVEELLTKISEP